LLLLQSVLTNFFKFQLNHPNKTEDNNKYEVINGNHLTSKSHDGLK